MASEQGVVTAYDLPYAVMLHSPPLLQGGQTVLVRASIKAGVDEEAADTLTSMMTSFDILANTGALGGDTVAPWDSGLEEISEPRITAKAIEWELQECNLDERAAVILAQLFLLTQADHPLRELEIFRPGRTKERVEMAHLPSLRDPYPPVWPKVPFPLDIDEDTFDSPTLYAVFARHLDPDEKSAIEGEILDWAIVPPMGVYGVAPVPLQLCSMVPEQSVTFVDNELEWPMTRFRSHPNALNGLINVCLAINHDIAPIAELRIE